MSAPLTALINTEVKLQFAVFDVDGITPLSGLLDGDFINKVVLRDETDQTGSITLTVTEIGSTGKYVASFTPDARGLWYVEATAPSEDVFGCHVDVGLFNSMETLRKETSNAHEVDIDTQEEIAYDDDGVTPVQKWDLATKGGEDVNTQLGVQIRRGPAKLPRD